MHLYRLRFQKTDGSEHRGTCRQKNSRNRKKYSLTAAAAAANSHISGVLCCVYITGQGRRKTQRLLFEWQIHKLPRVERCTPSPHLSADPISRSSNRWLRLWLQISLIAGAFSVQARDINGSSPWEFSNATNYSPHQRPLVRR